MKAQLQDRYKQYNIINYATLITFDYQHWLQNHYKLTNTKYQR